MPVTQRIVLFGLIFGVNCTLLLAESALGEGLSTGWEIGRLIRVDNEESELGLMLLRVSHETPFVASQLDDDSDLLLEEWLEGPTQLLGPAQSSELSPPQSIPEKPEVKKPEIEPEKTASEDESLGGILQDEDDKTEPDETPDTKEDQKPSTKETEQAAETDDEDGSGDLADAMKAESRRQRLYERFAKLQGSPGSISLSSPISTEETLPENQAADLLSQDPPRYVAAMNLRTSIAPRVHTQFCHQPLYFEEVNLERCGRVDCEDHGCLQNVYSTFWFLTGTTLLPYRLATEPIGCCVTSAPDCRTCQRVGCSIAPLKKTAKDLPMVRGLAAEAAAIAGFTFLLL